MFIVYCLLFTFPAAPPGRRRGNVVASAGLSMSRPGLRLNQTGPHHQRGVAVNTGAGHKFVPAWTEMGHITFGGCIFHQRPAADEMHGGQRGRLSGGGDEAAAFNSVATCPEPLLPGFNAHISLL